MLLELTETRYGKGDFIFREGDPVEYFHIVKEGTVKCEDAHAWRSLLLRYGDLQWSFTSRLSPTDGGGQHFYDE